MLFLTHILATVLSFWIKNTSGIWSWSLFLSNVSDFLDNIALLRGSHGLPLVLMRAIEAAWRWVRVIGAVNWHGNIKLGENLFQFKQKETVEVNSEQCSTISYECCFVWRFSGFARLSFWVLLRWRLWRSEGILPKVKTGTLAGKSVQCNFNQNKYHMNWLEIKSGHSWWRAGDYVPGSCRLSDGYNHWSSLIWNKIRIVHNEKLVYASYGERNTFWLWESYGRNN
jgi:hypothetical protein